jgi:hypothetical protein
MIDSSNEATDTQEMPPNAIAFVVDNQIVDILYVNDVLSAVLTSDPVILNITNLLGGENVLARPSIGWIYNPDENTIFSTSFDGDPIVHSLNNN